jgi:negative regulator of sigma E activity
MIEDPIIPAANRASMTPEEKGAALRAEIIERASELRDQASELLQNGIEFAKQRPYATAAVAGGVAAAAAAAVYGGVKLAERRNGVGENEVEFTPSPSLSAD